MQETGSFKSLIQDCGRSQMARIVQLEEEYRLTLKKQYKKNFKESSSNASVSWILRYNIQSNINFRVLKNELDQKNAIFNQIYQMFL